MLKRLRIKVEGLVQGVSFRVGALRTARKLGLTGFATNEADGSVVVEVEGDPDRISQFLEWCRVGPPLAEVSKVTYDEIVQTGDPDFSIR